MGGKLSKGQGGFIKNNMSGDDESVGGEVETAIPLVIGGISKEDAKSGARRELVRHGGRKVRITFASEDVKVIIGRWRSV